MNLYIGIDWSEKKHDAVFMNESGSALLHLLFPHAPDGFAYFDDTRQKFAVPPEACLIGLETAHNLLIDFLWDRGYSSVYVIPPSVVKSSRGRYGSSGARTDESDATLLADLVRTDRPRLHPWSPGSILSRHLRAQVSWLMFLTRDVVRLSNRLRSILLRYYPAVLSVFGDLTAQIALEFIQAYPTPEAAHGLTYEQFQDFARRHHYPQPRRLATCFVRLQAPHPEATPAVAAMYQAEAQQLAMLLLQQVRAKLAASRTLLELFAQHPDRALYDSLPGAGDFLAPALVAKLGDDRARFPSAESVQALAGTCPVTKRSGKWRQITFRRACDREFRHIAQQWAKCSLRESTWAATYHQQQVARGASESQAYRCLANRWLAILWHLWQTHQTYDEDHHMQECLRRRQPRR